MVIDQDLGSTFPLTNEGSESYSDFGGTRYKTYYFSKIGLMGNRYITFVAIPRSNVPYSFSFAGRGFKITLMQVISVRVPNVYEGVASVDLDHRPITADKNGYHRFVVIPTYYNEAVINLNRGESEPDAGVPSE